ncbi:putative nuclease HARBI1 [Zophobas morio]|uniref:putative nuclease HARBI1 n=1 Tax=Zophobas morio TaxID=2755281 RepID=UPI003083E40F
MTLQHLPETSRSSSVFESVCRSLKSAEIRQNATSNIILTIALEDLCDISISDPGFQTGVAEDIGVSQPAVSYTIKCVAQKIMNKAHIWIRFPQDNEAIQEEKQRWLRRYNFPTAIGAISCTLIRIKKIHVYRHGNEYICRKQFPALNVQATCNAEEYFTSVSAEWPGSVHDSRIWRNSSVCRVFRTFNNAVLLGDQGYGIEKCLMIPYRNPATPREETFNNLLKRERVIIERCFGQLKQRFPTLQNIIRLRLLVIPSFIGACFVLHNVAKHLKDEAVLEEENNNDNDDDNLDEEDNNDPAQEVQRLVYPSASGRLKEELLVAFKATNGAQFKLSLKSAEIRQNATSNIILTIALEDLCDISICS